MLCHVGIGRTVAIKIGKIVIKISMFKNLWRKIYRSIFLRSWFAVSAVYASASVCPCCGKQGCPVGLGAAAVVGGILTSFGMWVGRLIERMS